MTEVQNTYTNRYRYARHLMNLKDAVKTCMQILSDYTDVSKVDVAEICEKFKDSCFVGSNKWESK